MTLQERPEIKSSSKDDWTLNAAQMLFMLQHHNPIETAYTDDDMEFLRLLSKSEAYREVFEDMPWDEAFDRYECMLEAGDGNA